MFPGPSWASFLSLTYAEDGFERHILVEADGETLAELYLGESAGFRRSYLRRAGDAAVYELEIAAFDFATDPQQWADKTLLNRDADQVQAFGMADWTLERTEDGWALKDDEREVDVKKADELLADLSRLSYIAVEPAKQDDAAKPLAVARLRLKAGENRTPVISVFGRRTEEVWVSSSFSGRRAEEIWVSSSLEDERFA